MTLIDVIHKRDAELQKILDSMENKKVFNRILLWLKVWWQDTQRQLLWNSPWKDAQGDDLPEIDREVIVLTQPYPNDEHLRVVFAHRPNKYTKVWNSDLGEEQVVEIERYGKGEWNIPNIVYWLDTKSPYEENKISK